MSHKIFYGADARRRLLLGAEALYNAVKTTMGPDGNNAILDRGYGGPKVTHDGVSVAKSIKLPDIDDETLGQRIGAELIQQAALKMEQTGDGTTTVTVLTYHILREADTLIAGRHNPMKLRKGLEAAATTVIEAIKEMSESVEPGSPRIEQIAAISAGDPEIGKLVADVVAAVGRDGFITVETSQGLELEKEVVEGYSFDRGYTSQYMVSDRNRMEAVLENPAILVTDEKITSVQQIIPVLQQLASTDRKDLVIIADEVESEALATLVLNKLKGVFNAVVVKAPAYGELRKSTLEDIAILVGGRVYGESTGLTYRDNTLEGIGTARKVIVTKDSTTIIQGAAKSEDVEARLSELQTQVDKASGYSKELLVKRRAALASKIAVIKVGGASETEIGEKKDRVDDAVAAVRAALDGGIIPGGGVSLVKAASSIADSRIDVDYGATILKKALYQPFRILIENAGENADEWLPKVRDHYIGGYGINLRGDHTYGINLEDMKSIGVIDPTNVAIEAVRNAVSIAGTAMTAGALTVNIPEDKTADQSQMGMM